MDTRILLAIGVVVVAFSQYVASHLTQAAGFWDMVKPNMIRSLGLGFIFIPVSMIALSGIPLAQRGNATGLFNLTRELGGSLGTALMGMLVSDDIKRYGSYLAEHIDPYSPQVQEQLQQTAATLGSQTYSRDLAATAMLKLKVTNQAMVLSFENGFRWTAFAMALGMLLVLVLRRPQPSAAPVDAH